MHDDFDGILKTFGSGCVGSRGVPLRAPRLGDLPRVGQPFTLQASSLPLSGTAYMFLGASNSICGGLTLPSPLGGIGMPGCSLLVSGDILFSSPIILGTALFSLPVASLPGATIYNQAFIVDPTANVLGLTVSNTGEGTIGS